MTLDEIKLKIDSPEYDFLRTNKYLGNNIILLTIGGSHAYGTNKETSDLDVRGCALNNKYEILTNQNFQQFVNEETDTTIYSFNKFISLITACNPNTIEMLGNKPEHYLYMSKTGKFLLDNRHMFLSKRAIYSFGGYATDQLRRLENMSNIELGQEQNERHILGTIQHASENFKERYGKEAYDAFNIYIDKSKKENYNTELFLDIDLSHYPLRDCAKMVEEMLGIVKSYKTIGMRNSRAYEHGKISKHMMHLLRLYMMCLDILEKEQIVTYRENEHDLLMYIRNGNFVDENNQVKSEFYDLVNDYVKRFEYASNNTSLPEKPNMKKINDFIANVNESVVRGNAEF